MDLSPILDSLNDAQRAAVTAPVGPVLVLAGAGSGKTRVLTHRIAWVIQTQGASPHSILAVTFTNKAAHEMRARIEKLLGIPGSSMWVGTFHGIAHRLLRLHWRDAGLPQTFQILDGEDQLRLIKKIVKAMELDEARWVPREFQDTNAIQYAWSLLVAGQNGAPFVVGDDDQSIYRWRGARVENLTRFSKDYPAAKLFRLEQNYRSTGNILKAANALISNNTGRLGKNLWTQGSDGERIKLYAAFNERDEAEFVMHRIREWTNQGGARRDVAILYRSNAQSRVFEEIFMSARIPYKVYGSLRFFERAEIKDALAYLRIITNHSDDASFERVVNLPTRGIGNTSLDVVREQAKAASISLWDAAAHCVANGVLRPQAEAAVNGFLKLVEQLGRDIDGLELHEQVDHVINNSGLVEHHKKEKADRGEARVENLNELVSAARGFEPDGLNTDDESLPPLDAFLSHAVLESGEGQAEAWDDCIQMMTLHTAKGLEFPVVFLCGLEDGLFPHQRSLNDAEGLEEERRLCYVGTTRAMKQLFMTYADQRRLHGQDNFGTPSRFISEIPEDLIEEV